MSISSSVSVPSVLVSTIALLTTLYEASATACGGEAAGEAASGGAAAAEAADGIPLATSAPSGRPSALGGRPSVMRVSKIRPNSLL